MQQTLAMPLSIWQTISREDFCRNIHQLQKITNVFSLPRKYSDKDWPPRITEDNMHLLLLDAERYFAYDIAFLAACEEGAKHVSAATAECTRDPDSIRIRVASNEGVREKVRKGLEGIVAQLIECAAGSMSRRVDDLARVSDQI